jgi:hypothetical protein
MAGCSRRLPVSASAEPLDVVLVPGCPSRDDGSLSGCQWQRVLWAHRLWEQGTTRAFVVSGNAVYNRYVEAEALRAGLVALGVPEERVVLETQALHTDENASYALDIFRTRQWTRFGVASHGGHAKGVRAFWTGWGEPPAAIFPMDMQWMQARMGEPRPDVRTDPVPEDEWLPLADREREIARRTQRRKRPHSIWVYSWAALRGAFGSSPRPLPPMPEPTLEGRRHRVDTAPW